MESLNRPHGELVEPRMTGFATPRMNASPVFLQLRHNFVMGNRAPLSTERIVLDPIFKPFQNGISHGTHCDEIRRHFGGRY
ncbi:hypothetical protein FHW16_005360 [Phyllobacterium myrsinacearum]|uniref:Uncharacterized protein n=1 Tax=Phyllobacterium myrsinacearum TaxID=28101 RepID=A0A839ERQ8_9HYPH|nr:hypothetical protein [Phyllobacterium myrsinacearum]